MRCFPIQGDKPLDWILIKSLDETPAFIQSRDLHGFHCGGRTFHHVYGSEVEQGSKQARPYLSCSSP